jgi:hypothetical protein
MIANSPQAILATDSAAMAKNKFSHVLRLIPMSKCGSAIVAHAPITTAQMNVTQLMGTKRKGQWQELRGNPASLPKLAGRNRR